MTSATLTPEAKEALRKCIRGLRERLLVDLREAAEATYRLSVALDKAALPEAQHVRRQRLESWLDEQVRAEVHGGDKAKGKKSKATKVDPAALRVRFLRQAEKEAASTLLNRLVFLRHVEALGLYAPAVVTGGWQSQAYKELRDFAPALCSDETEGYAHLLGLVFDELAYDLPGLFGDVGLTRLFPVPAPTLRAVIEALNAPELEPAWTDDTTLGWVYQFYNDPEREALDAKINDGGKIEPHEIASKTQMFTERYMVEWLLHNSLGQMWLAMCAKHGWRAQARDVLDGLEARRAVWRAKRDAGEVSLEALMPIESALEDRWKYWVPQPMPDDAIEHAPDTLRDLRLLDPACGSGHFLVVAFDLLAALYREEAKHRGERWSDAAIAQWIVEDNLHGVDIDPRAVQLAAAGLWVKARQLSGEVQLRRMNLVAPVLKLAGLPEDDPALVRLKDELHRSVSLEPALTQKLVDALAGVDHLGSLLKVDAAIDEALAEQEKQLRVDPSQGDLFVGYAPTQLELTERRESVLDRLELFLDAHAAEGDLGLRLEGEQLQAGVRFVRMVREGRFDLVVGNPPYQGVSKLSGGAYVQKQYPEGKADLYAVFLRRCQKLAKRGGVFALLTMRGWMFLSQFSDLRQKLLHEADLRTLGDIDRGGFEDILDEVVSTTMSVFRSLPPAEPDSVAVLPTPLDDSARDRFRTARKRAALLCQRERHEFDARAFEAIGGEPIVYWWSEDFLTSYEAAPKLETIAESRKGICTNHDARYIRCAWEVGLHEILLLRRGEIVPLGENFYWVPTVQGGKDRAWLEPVLRVIDWRRRGLQIKVSHLHKYGVETKYLVSQDKYFVPGVAFSKIGSSFTARAHRVRSIFADAGPSVFPEDIPNTVCLLNSRTARLVLESLNPTVNFQVGDVDRLPYFKLADSEAVFSAAELGFGQHESTREPSVEFRHPGPSPWRYAQDWAQRAVDRPEGEPLPPYDPEYDDPDPTAWISFAIGVALGRFGADGEGILEQAPDAALPGGILFVSDATGQDSLTHAACAGLNDAWAEHGPAIDEGTSVREWLRKSFFSDVHRKMYENRPIYFPLSSEKKSFVAFASIHRWSDTTLQTLLADHLLPEQRALDGELDDLRKARHSTDKKQARQADKRFEQVKKLHEELTDFIAAVRQCAEKGPPPTDGPSKKGGAPEREVDAPYRMDLDDGVMVNSAALWPLLQPQWKDPKKWWKQLATAKGKKDYDWSHLAARYFPTRVDEKARQDPSLGVAHACFWKYHPAKAYAWELRLQDEIEPGFTIDEPGSDELRGRFLADHPDEARDIEDKEAKRRERKRKKEAKP